MIGSILTILFSILIILLGIFLVSKYQLWFTKHRLSIISIFMLAGIIIYTIGYLAKSPFDYVSSGLMAIFSTGRMFVFENDISSFEANVAGLPYYTMVFGIIMTFSMLTTGMIVLSFMGYRVMCRIQLKFIMLLSKKIPVYIFTKLNNKALLLADDIKQKHKKSIILLCIDDPNATDEDKKLEQTASEKGYIIFPTYNNDGVSMLCKKFKLNPIYLFAISKYDYENVIFTQEFVQQIKEVKNIDHIKLYTFIKNKEYEDLFLKEIYMNFDIHIINENDLVSRQLFNKFILNSCIEDSNVLTVCIAGFTEFSEELYKNVTFLGQCHGVKLKIILIEEGIKDKSAIFFQQNPEIEKCAEFIFLDLKQNSKGFYDYFNLNMKNINTVIIVNGDFRTSAELSRICSCQMLSTRICAYSKNQKEDSLLIQTNIQKEVLSFGSEKEIYTEDIIINETLDQLAKEVHNYYRQMYPGTEPWNRISLFDKQSSRALALHMQSKLYSIGLNYVKGGNTTLFEKEIQDTEVLEKLSRGEHLRWNAYSFANGWRTMKDYQTQERNKDTIKKTHSCLVDWDDLDEVSKKFQKDYKEIDRVLIRNVGNILKSAGYGIERINY